MALAVLYPSFAQLNTSRGGFIRPHGKLLTACAVLGRSTVQRVKTKIDDDLSAALRGLAAMRHVGVGDYARQVVDVFIHGAIKTAARVASGVVEMPALESKCDQELNLCLSDDDGFDTAGGVHALAILEGKTPSAVLRNILTVHCFGSTHAVSVQLCALPGHGKKGDGK